MAIWLVAEKHEQIPRGLRAFQAARFAAVGGETGHRAPLGYVLHREPVGLIQLGVLSGASGSAVGFLKSAETTPRVKLIIDMLARGEKFH